MPDIKEHLISPFSLVPFSTPHPKNERSFQMCKCDSDEENNFGMAPNCVFYCALNAIRNKLTKTRKPHPAKKTRKH